ncbi:MAG: DEAD/DEAH box helicase [Actinomycetota bacterium]|nr:DEAD/DEAH box helicase [Actinomycetota bacterium]
MLGLAHDADFSVPGAGKTTKSYALYEAERHSGNVTRLLVIAPLSAFDSWIDEAELSLEPAPVVQRFEGRVGATTEVLLVNYQRLASNYEVIAQWVAGAPTQVVLDEAHRMKRGWVGEWGRACLSIAYLAHRRQVLTGTPAPQGPRDLVAIVDFLWPNQALRVLPGDALRPSPPADAGRMVAESIRSLFVRTRKSELGLPPVTYRASLIPLRPLHTQVYAALRDQYAGQFKVGRRERLDLVAMNKVVMYMLEAATNPKLLTAGSTDGDPEEFRHPPLDIPLGSPLTELIRDYNLYERPGKFEELGVLVKANAERGRKTLVWSNFVRNLKTLERELARYQPALVHGAVPAYLPEPTEMRTREKEIGRFRSNGDCMVLLANPQAMSEGISLHMECHDAIWLDRTYNAGQYLQGVDRIHRLGLPPGQETRITFLISEGTIDESVDARVALKAKRLGDMLDDPDISIMSLPNDEDYGSAIESARDVDALFKHLRGEDE